MRLRLLVGDVIRRRYPTRREHPVASVIALLFGVLYLAQLLLADPVIAVCGIADGMVLAAVRGTVPLRYRRRARYTARHRP